MGATALAAAEPEPLFALELGEQALHGGRSHPAMSDEEQLRAWLEGLEATWRDDGFMLKTSDGDFDASRGEALCAIVTLSGPDDPSGNLKQIRHLGFYELRQA